MGNTKNNTFQSTTAESALPYLSAILISRPLVKRYLGQADEKGGQDMSIWINPGCCFLPKES